MVWLVFMNVFDRRLMMMYHMFGLIAICSLAHDHVDLLALTIVVCFMFYLCLNSFKDDMRLDPRFMKSSLIGLRGRILLLLYERID